MVSLLRLLRLLGLEATGVQVAGTSLLADYASNDVSDAPLSWWRYIFFLLFRGIFAARRVPNGRRRKCSVCKK